METLPPTKSCFVCGHLNSAGLRLRFETDGRIVRTQLVMQPAHVGFKDTVHGGLISTVLDEVMTWACGVKTKRFAYCAELTVRFHHPARPGVPLVATGELVHDRRGRLFEARADMRDDQNVLLASATGKYMPIADQTAAAMLVDLEGSPGALFGSPG